MISYEPLWRTMAEKGITTYSLMKDHKIESKTIYNLKHNRNTTALTLEKLCIALNCGVQDVIEFLPDESETR